MKEKEGGIRVEVYVVGVQESAENEVGGFKHSLQFGRVGANDRKW